MPSSHQSDQKNKADNTSTKKPLPQEATPQIDQTHPGAAVQRAMANPGALSPGDIQRMQQAGGNRAVARLLSHSTPASTVQRTPDNVIQRTAERANVPEAHANGCGCPACSIQRKPKEEEEVQMKAEPGIHISTDRASGYTTTVQRMFPASSTGGGTTLASPDVTKIPAPGGGPIPTPFPNVASNTTLKKGSKGTKVKAVQEALIKHGISLGKYGADGDFGSTTKAAVIEFQKSHGLTPDGIVGPKTMQALMSPAQSTPTQTTAPATQNAAGGSMWDSLMQGASDLWESVKNTWDEMKVTTTDAGDGLKEATATTETTAAAPTTETAPEQPAPADPAKTEWDANPKIHHHFENGLATYRALRPLYQQKGIQNPAQYLTDNIVTVTFFGRRTPAHKDLVGPLQAAEKSLKEDEVTPDISSFWAFVPRLTAHGTLSNHSMGRAFDVNPSDNPHITRRDESRVIEAVTGVDMKSRQSADDLRTASETFQSTFNQAWVDEQKRILDELEAKQNPSAEEKKQLAAQKLLVSSINGRRAKLNKYAQKGFYNLDQNLVDALIAAGFEWGGQWQHSKDFMHFEM